MIARYRSIYVSCGLCGGGIGAEGSQPKTQSTVQPEEYSVIVHGYIDHTFFAMSLFHPEVTKGVLGLIGPTVEKYVLDIPVKSQCHDALLGRSYLLVCAHLRKWMLCQPMGMLLNPPLPR